MKIKSCLSLRLSTALTRKKIQNEPNFRPSQRKEKKFLWNKQKSMNNFLIKII